MRSGGRRSTLARAARRGGTLLVMLLVAMIGTVAWRTTRLRAPTASADTPVLATHETVDTARAVLHLSTALRFQTVSHEDASEDTPAAWEAQRAWLVRTYPAFHANATRELVGAGTLLYTWRGSAPELAPIILMAHQDVVPAATEATAGAANPWQVPPFSGELRDGAIWGRGAVDDKGSLISLFEALETLSERGFTPKRTIYLVSGHDEETLGLGAHAAAQVLLARGVHALYALDEGLFVLSDHPITHHAAALIAVAEKGFATLKITARAAGGHSSAPPDEGAVVTLSRALLAIMNHPAPLKVTALSEQMLRALAPQLGLPARIAVANRWLFSPLLVAQFAATPAGAAMLHTTMAPTVLQGSLKSNVLPEVVVGKINYRLAPGDSAAAALARARQAVGTLPVELAWDAPVREASTVSSSVAPPYRVLAALAADIWAAPAAPALMIAGTDGTQMSTVAQAVYRFQPIRLSLAESAMIHGRDEHLALSSLTKMIEFYTRLVLTTAG